VIKLGRTPKTSFAELVAEMARASASFRHEAMADMQVI
jgi:hypothetical protein